MKKLMTVLFVLGMTGCGIESPDDKPAPPTDEVTSDLQSTDGSADPNNAACGRTGPNIDNARHNDAPADGAANQRSGSSTGCAAVGVLQPTDDAIYFCWTLGTDGFTWTYLQSVRTGVRGWVRDNLLDGNGAVNNCGF